MRPLVAALVLLLLLPLAEGAAPVAEPIVAAGTLRTTPIGIGCPTPSVLPPCVQFGAHAIMRVDPADGSGSLMIVRGTGPLHEVWPAGSCTIDAALLVTCPGVRLHADGLFEGYGYRATIVRSDTVA